MFSAISLRTFRSLRQEMGAAHPRLYRAERVRDGAAQTVMSPGRALDGSPCH